MTLELGKERAAYKQVRECQAWHSRNRSIRRTAARSAPGSAGSAILQPRPRDSSGLLAPEPGNVLAGCDSGGQAKVQFDKCPSYITRETNVSDITEADARIIVPVRNGGERWREAAEALHGLSARTDCALPMTARPSGLCHVSMALAGQPSAADKNHRLCGQVPQRISATDCKVLTTAIRAARAQE